MIVNFRNQCTKHLRILGFKVSTKKGGLSFNWYSLFFDDVERTITVYNPHWNKFNLNIPYSTPAKMLEKMRKYFSYDPYSTESIKCNLERVPALNLTSTEIQAEKDKKKALKKKPKNYKSNYNSKLPAIYG